MDKFVIRILTWVFMISMVLVYASSVLLCMNLVPDFIFFDTSSMIAVP